MSNNLKEPRVCQKPLDNVQVSCFINLCTFKFYLTNHIHICFITTKMELHDSPMTLINFLKILV